MRLARAFEIGLCASLLAGAAAAQWPPAQCAAVPGDPLPGPFERNWDWTNNRRQLTYCFDPATPALIAFAAEFAAENLSNAGLGWNLVNAHICPRGWSLRNPVPGQPDIRVRAARLGPVPVVPGGGGNFPDHPHDWEYPSDRPRPDDPYPDYPPSRPPKGGGEGPWWPGGPGPGGGGGAPRFVRPPLAYFQSGPFTVPGGRWIRSGEIVFNWEPAAPRNPAEIPADPKWHIFIDDLNAPNLTYDPRIVGMHEFGHAIRLDHDDTNFDTDVSVYPTGSRTPAAGTVIIRRTPPNALASRVLPDDAVVGGDLTAGMNQIADSGKKMNVMKTFAIIGQHGINPLLGLPPNSAYSYTEKERATARAACRDRPAMLPPPPIQLAAGLGRWQQWGFLMLQDGSGNPVHTYAFALMVGNGVFGDHVEAAAPAAAGFTAKLTTTVDGLPGSTDVTVLATAGATPATGFVLVPVPFSSLHSSLTVKADWAADVITISDGFSTFCGGALSTFDPSDCGPHAFANAGFLALELTGPGPIVP